MTNASTATIFDLLPFTATRDQARALYGLQAFLDGETAADCFLLRGCAGTGKTSILNAVVEYLAERETPHFLMAPTGRAAKVLGQKTGVQASTVHHLIYMASEDDQGRIRLVRRANPSPVQKVFVVDEASMVSDLPQTDGDFSAPNSLLYDLLDYVRQGNPDSKIIFVGDGYQLPPVPESRAGRDASPALDVAHLATTYGLTAQTDDLREVVRQGADSPVLRLAGQVRDRFDGGHSLAGFALPQLGSYGQALRYFLDRFGTDRPEAITLVGCTNNTVHAWNTLVRERLGLAGNWLSRGDFVVLNETHLLGTGGMLANGETAVVRAVGQQTENRCGLTFADAELQFTDADGEPFVLRGKVLLDPLTNATGAYSREAYQALVADRMKYNPTYRNSKRRSDDPYLGAFRLRWAYGLTGHKAQGGEWDEVLVHPYFRPDGHRYLYTALTRARNQALSWTPSW